MGNYRRSAQNGRQNGAARPWARVPTSTLRRAGASHPAITLYGILAEHACRETGNCRPSLRTLAREMGLAETSARHIKRD